MAKSREPEPRTEGLILERLTPAAREAGFWLTGALAVVLAVALFSFNRSDASYTVSTSNTHVHNLIGPAGAWVSDFLLFNISLRTLPLILSLILCRIKSKFFPILNLIKFEY